MKYDAVIIGSGLGGLNVHILFESRYERSSA